MTESLTAVDIERMRADHVAVESSLNGRPLTECKHCREGYWPCDAARLLAEIERQADLAAAVERICVALGLKRDAAYDPRTTMLGGLARPGEYTNFNAQAHRDTQRLSGPLDERN